MSTNPNVSATVYVPPAGDNWGRLFQLVNNRLIPTPQGWTDEIGPLEKPRFLSPGWRNDLYDLVVAAVARTYPGRHIFVEHLIPRAIGNSQYVVRRPDSPEQLVLEDFHLVGVWNQNPGGQNAVFADIVRRLRETFGE